MLNTPHDDEAPGCGNQTMPARGRRRTALVWALLIILIVIGSVAKESAAFVGALILYLVENAPARMKVSFAKLLAAATEPLSGCRACQA